VVPCERAKPGGLGGKIAVRVLKQADGGAVGFLGPLFRFGGDAGKVEHQALVSSVGLYAFAGKVGFGQQFGRVLLHLLFGGDNETRGDIFNADLKQGVFR
jgi:hypothetical protein